MIANIRTVRRQSMHFDKKSSISSIFVCQELDDEGGGRLLGYGLLLE